MLNNGKNTHLNGYCGQKIEIKKSGSAVTSAVSQLVYMPNLRAIGQSVWEKKGNRQKHRKTDIHT